MNVSYEPELEMTRAISRAGQQDNLPMRDRMHVMAVGRVERTCNLHDALLAEKRVWLSVATDYRELWMRSNAESVHVFVLCETLTRFELEETSRFIRQQWPHARILVIQDGESFLDDPLYDDRLLPDAPSEILVAAIEKLLNEGCE